MTSSKSLRERQEARERRRRRRRRVGLSDLGRTAARALAVRRVNLNKYHSAFRNSEKQQDLVAREGKEGVEGKVEL